MKYSKGMLYGVLGLILAHPVYAAIDCSSGAPSCVALGYTETTCSSGSYVACPYDKTKKKCIPVAPTCEDLGFTVNDKSAWCTNIVECPSNSEYTLCAWHGFEGNCEKEGYSDINEDLLCTDVFKELREGTVCVEECWSDCADAGYDRDITDVSSDVYCKGGTRTLYRHINDNIDDSTSVDCGKDCYQVYSTCEDADLIDPMYCHVTESKYAKTIYTSDAGTSKTCYTECTQYAQCSHIGPGYYSSVPSGQICSSADYTLSDGTKKKCFFNCKEDTRCKDELEDCKNISCYNECAGYEGYTYDWEKCQNTCLAKCQKAYEECSGQSLSFMLHDLTKINIASISEDFAKEKYVNALEFNEEDCTVYDS